MRSRSRWSSSRASCGFAWRGRFQPEGGSSITVTEPGRYAVFCFIPQGADPAVSPKPCRVAVRNPRPGRRHPPCPARHGRRVPGGRGLEPRRRRAEAGGRFSCFRPPTRSGHTRPVTSTDELVERLRARDPTIWGPADTPELADRLGWVDLPVSMAARVGELAAIADEAVADGTDHVVLLGMGGSSLAPEVFASVLGVAGRLSAV